MPNEHEDEQFAQDQFDKYFRDELGLEELGWEIPAKDPPDRILKIRQEEYAVEVTRLIEHFKDQRDSQRSVPFLAIEDVARKFVLELEQEANKKGILSGTYYLKFPLASTRLSQLCKQHKPKILNFIEQSQVEVVASARFEVPKLGSFRVRKTSNDQNKIDISFYPSGGVRWAGDDEDIRELINHAISTKKQKMQNISTPKILLLLSEFPLDYDYRACLDDLNDKSAFHTIFVTSRWRDEDTQDYILYSTNRDWLKS